ncbi:MAG: acetyl-CoA carboxylase biotin carboxyl carrier protein subunit [Verrucomicrobia bacterium]|nr:acetyl-CoA carboxylase biotin carboxyl carrier protein subunit [Verrucomicrobiota bacterium]
MAEETLVSAVTGSVWKIEIQEGQPVAAGGAVMILESMKMEIPIEATIAGVVFKLMVKEGDSVEEGQAVAVIKG